MKDAARWPGLMALLLTVLLGTAGAARAAPIYELKSGSGRIVLLGSIHFLRPEDGALPAAASAALKDADAVYLELDLDDLDAAGTAALLLSLARDPENRDLPALLGPSAWSRAQSAAEESGLDLTIVTPFEPWYAAMLISQLRMQQLGFDPDRGIESQIVALANRTGTDIRGLETMEQELGALDALSLPAQREFLLQTLADAATLGDQVDSMIAAWKAADTDALEDQLLADLESQQEVYRKVVVERNQRFARVIAGLAGDGRDYLVVMGTLHLVGPDSVVRLLKDRGLKVQPVAGSAPRRAAAR